MNNRIFQLCFLFVSIILSFLLCVSCAQKPDAERPFVRYLLETTISDRITGISTADDFDLNPRTETIKNSKAGLERRNPITGHTLPYARTYKYTSKDLTDSMKYGAMDIYETDEESVGFLYQSDQLAFYYDTEGFSAKREQLFEKEDLDIIAKAFLDFVFGSGWDTDMHLSVQEMKGSEEYYLTYLRSAFDYTLFDDISVTINGAGKVVGFNARRFGILKDFEREFTAEDIESAKSAIVEKMNSFDLEIIRVGAPLVQANSNGEPFLTMSIATWNIDEKGNKTEAIDRIATPLRISNP